MLLTKGLGSSPACTTSQAVIMHHLQPAAINIAMSSLHQDNSIEGPWHWFDRNANSIGSTL